MNSRIPMLWASSWQIRPAVSALMRSSRLGTTLFCSCLVFSCLVFSGCSLWPFAGGASGSAPEESPHDDGAPGDSAAADKDSSADADAASGSDTEEKEEKPEYTEEEYVRRAESAYGRGLYTLAREHFSKLREEYPGTPFEGFAQLKTADSYFFARDFSAAIPVYEEFLKLHPGHEAAAYARLQIGNAHLEQYTGPAHDQSPMRQAQENFERVLSDYPGSYLSSLAKDGIAHCRSALRAHEAFVAEFYRRAGKEKATEERLSAIRSEREKGKKVHASAESGDAEKNEPARVQPATESTLTMSADAPEVSAPSVPPAPSAGPAAIPAESAANPSEQAANPTKEAADEPAGGEISMTAPRGSRSESATPPPAPLPSEVPSVPAATAHSEKPHQLAAVTPPPASSPDSGPIPAGPRQPEARSPAPAPPLRDAVPAVPAERSVESERSAGAPSSASASIAGASIAGAQREPKRSQRGAGVRPGTVCREVGGYSVAEISFSGPFRLFVSRNQGRRLVTELQFSEPADSRVMGRETAFANCSTARFEARLGLPRQDESGLNRRLDILFVKGIEYRIFPMDAPARLVLVAFTQ